MSVNPHQPRPRSFRYRVRLALLGVLLVTLPAVGLTLHYLREIRTTADSVASRAAVLHEVEQVRGAISDLALPDGLSLSEEARQRLQRELAEIAERSLSIADAYPVHLAALSELAATAQSTIRSVNTWQLESERAPAARPAPAAGMLGPLLAVPLDEASANDNLVLARGKVLEGALSMGRMVQAVIITTLDDMRAISVSAEDTVAQADRNLVTITLLALVVMVMLLLVLPSALVEPIRRLTRNVRAASQGRPLVVGDGRAEDELGELAEAVGETVQALLNFDAMKRDRIVEDGGKLEALLKHAGGPAAILGPQLGVEAANRAFLALVGSKTSDDEIPLPELLGGAGSELAQLLLRVREHRHEATDTVQITGIDGKTKSWRVTVDVCRDRRARPTHLLLILREPPAPGT